VFDISIQGNSTVRRGNASHDRERGISPVVGTALFIAIVVSLGVLVSALVLGLADTGAVAPESKLALQDDAGCEARLVHEQGERLDGDQLRLKGAADPDTLAGEQLDAGDTAAVRPTADEVTVIWTAANSDTSHTLGQFDAPVRAASWLCGTGTLYAGDGGDLTVVEAEDGTLTTLSVPSTIEALGPVTADLTDDGETDIPYVDSAGRVNVTGPSNETTTLASDADIAGSIEGSKTRLAVGSWDGSPTSVFFVNENHDTLYRVAGPDSAPVTVAAPGNGVQAVVGIADVDGDPAAELVFADASQQLRALQPDGSVEVLEDGQLGSNNGIGAGALVDVDGDGVYSVVAVDGGKDLKLAGDSTADGGEGTRTLATGIARKSPATVADVDGDEDDEVVFVSNDSQKLKYVDDLGGANTVELLTDTDGNPIQRSEETGVV
jgi:flagellin-like protein